MTWLLISQVYAPDAASVGQHMADTAAALARRGNRVVVVTADRGYDDPSVRYPRREVREGVEVRRVPLSSFGKKSIAVRVLGGLIFVAQAVLHGLTLRRLETVVVTTSPPMAPLAALVIGWFRRVRIKYWIMDLHPDQAIAVGAARAGSRSVRAFDWLNRRILARADDVIVLDRFMADRVVAKDPDVAARLSILPPWPLEDVAAPLPREGNTFRTEHDLGSAFVVMYSGNHTPSNPLTTLLAAAARMTDAANVQFLFVGGGIGKREVEASRSPNVRSLPYQPRERLTASLSAADVHVVTIGNQVVGMVHPCKVYGAMAVGRPILVFGPPDSHIADILREERIGWHVNHGDVDGAVAAIDNILSTPREELEAMGIRAQQAIQNRFSRRALITRLCDVLERR